MSDKAKLFFARLKVIGWMLLDALAMNLGVFLSIIFIYYKEPGVNGLLKTASVAGKAALKTADTAGKLLYKGAVKCADSVNILE